MLRTALVVALAYLISGCSIYTFANRVCKHEPNNKEYMDCTSYAVVAAHEQGVSCIGSCAVDADRR